MRPLETTATRLWKRLTRDERLSAARSFFAQPASEMLGSAIGAIVKARHLRPQVARALGVDEQARALASIADPGESLAGSLVVALHLGERRALLTTFLDAAGLPHEEGVLVEEGDDPSPLPEDKARSGVQALRSTFPPEQVEVYLNALWLQDPERWAVLERAGEWA